MFSNRDLRALLVPLVIEQILTAFMGTADTIMVSNVSAAAISGVSLVDSINKLVIFLFTAIATGGTIICSQYVGHKELDKSRNAARQVVITSLLLSIGVMLFCLFTRRKLLRLIFGSVEADVMENALSYYFVTAFSYPFIALFGACSAIFRASGNSKTPMKVSAFCNILNVIGNAFFLFVLKIGVKGAALSTLISQALGAVILIYLLRGNEKGLSLGAIHEFRPDFRMIWLVICIGLPTGIENAMFQFGKLMVQSTVSTLGTAAITANAIVVILELFTSQPSLAVGTGLMTIAGQCMGAGEKEQAKQYIKKLTVIAFIVLIICNWTIFLLVKPVTYIAGLDAQAAQLTFRTMLVISIIKPFVWPLSFIPVNGMKAAGDIKFAMITSSLTMWVFRVGLSTLLCRHFGVGLIGIWCGYFVDWIARAIIYSLRFRSGKWTKHNVI